VETEETGEIDTEQRETEEGMVKMEEAEGSKNPFVLIETSMGTIKVELLQDKAPVTVKNFLDYANEKFYDGTIFHRVIQNFVIQGGGFTTDMEKKPTKPAIINEATNKLSNLKGTIAMARTQFVDSATSQFYINLKDNVNLDHRDETPEGYGYCVFGKVVEGMDVVETIGGVPTTTKDFFRDVPVTAVVINSVRVTE